MFILLDYWYFIFILYYFKVSIFFTSLQFSFSLSIYKSGPFQGHMMPFIPHHCHWSALSPCDPFLISLTQLTLLPWWWRQQVPPKNWYIFTKLHGIHILEYINWHIIPISIPIIHFPRTHTNTCSFIYQATPFQAACTLLHAVLIFPIQSVSALTRRFLKFHHLFISKLRAIVDKAEAVIGVAVGTQCRLSNTASIYLDSSCVCTNDAPEESLTHLRHNVWRSNHHASNCDKLIDICQR
jgi:hypothetical protein